MVEVSAEIGLGEEEIELDLGLGLSIGGSFRKPRTDLKPVVGFQSQSDLLDHSQHQNDGKKLQQKKRLMMMTRECDNETEEQQRGGISKRDRVSCGGGGGEGSVIQNVIGFNNGFAFPCWAPIGNNDKRNIVGSVAPTCSRGFQPFLAQSNGGGLEHNCYDERDGVNAFSLCSCSVVLEQPSSSHEGGGSSDSHSHSVHSIAETTQLHSSCEKNNTRNQPEQSASSHPVGSEQYKVERRNKILKEMQQKITCWPTELKEVATFNNETVPIGKSWSNENSSEGAVKQTKPDMGKPPKSLSQTSSLPQMPYVSTTGNGPNGKTINGFLYKYTKSEVSIVCVCHGSTFSPAEFVQHAGGTSISHPLRHITVIPSAFG